MRAPAPPATLVALAALAVLAAPASAVAQDVPPAPSADSAQAGPRAGEGSAGQASAVATTAALVVAGAAGAQLLHTPTAWPRTAAGFGKRVADQTGFYLVQTGTQRLIAHAITRPRGWRDDASVCPREALVGCALSRTFTLCDAGGARHANVPLLASVALATAASVSWRPERRQAGTAGTFVATRLGVVFAGYAAERMLLDWRAAGRLAGRRSARRAATGCPGRG